MWALLAAHECIDEQIVDVPLPQIAAKIPQVVESISQERISDDLPVPQVMEEPAVKQETVEEMEECPKSLSFRTRWKAPLHINECNSRLSRWAVGVGRLVLHARVQQRTVGGTVSSWPTLNEWNSGAPRNLRLRLNRQERASSQ